MKQCLNRPYSLQLNASIVYEIGVRNLLQSYLTPSVSSLLQHEPILPNHRTYDHVPFFFPKEARLLGSAGAERIGYQ